MQRLNLLHQQGVLSELDVQFARLLKRLHPALEPEAALAAACASHALEAGHTCLPLAEMPLIFGQITGQQAKTSHPGNWPSIEELRENLLASGAAAETGSSAAALSTPLVLDSSNRLSLLRWYRAEAHIAQNLGERAEGICELEPARVSELLTRLFPGPAAEQEASGPDLQRSAAALSLCKRLLILCGGPGTGKTYTLARLLALHQAYAAEGKQKLRIALAAPTGRAAMRLGESIRSAAASLAAPFHLQVMPEPQTLHRLLGYQPQSGAFLRSAANSLHVDLLVVDEASMVDVLLLEALLAALPATSRLILCGDPGQLPPVEPGSLLHSLQGVTQAESQAARCSPALRQCLQAIGADYGASAADESCAENATNHLGECCLTLQKAHRFVKDSGMLALAQALQEPGAEAFAAALAEPRPDVSFHAGKEAATLLPDVLLKQLMPMHHQAATAQEAMAAFSQSRVLCALRQGPWGVTGINSRCRELLQAQGLIPPRQELYRGLPILILRNDYSQGLYNGDTGMLWPDAEGELKAWFADLAGGDGLRQIAPAALPPWQPAYAQTVHKAQGAEFARVLLLLPPEDNPILSRELLYTAITRAKQELIVVAEQELLLTIASRRMVRHSNLERLLQTNHKNKVKSGN